MFANEVMSGAAYDELLAFTHRLGRGSELDGGPRLHFAHDNESALLRNDVEFAVTNAPIARNHGESVPLVPTSNQIFSPRATRACT